MKELEKKRQRVMFSTIDTVSKQLIQQARMGLIGSKELSIALGTLTGAGVKGLETSQAAFPDHKQAVGLEEERVRNRPPFIWNGSAASLLFHGDIIY